MRARAAEELRQIGAGRSTLDFVSERSKRLGKRVGPADRARRDENDESVRDVDEQLQMPGEWVNRPSPGPRVPPAQEVTPPGQ
ncbi:DUF1552 domain-containing protein [Gemmata sp.]|uniref:DUF1552 domain-containing protein n=1 Tax=Gemmata sp. TaxID=1914242 RepID=UPI003F715F92